MVLHECDAIGELIAGASPRAMKLRVDSCWGKPLTAWSNTDMMPLCVSGGATNLLWY